VARQSSNRRKGNPPRAAQTPPPEPEDALAAEEADEVAENEAEDEAAEAEDDAAEAEDDAAEDDDPEAHRALWEELRIDPVEIALPAGTGYTLRAYRMSTELTATDTSDRDEDDPFAARARQAELDDLEEDDETVVILDEEFLEAEEEEQPDRRRRRRDRDADDEPDDAADEDEGEEEQDEGEEVPVFLTHRGKLLLFRNPESLVSFVRSGADNDLAQVDTWTAMVERVQPGDIPPLDEDSYELDLVVENLRGGHDAWDPTLLIEAGEVARDLAYALRMPAVLDMLSPGSSLDDLDEALRSSVEGGVGGFLARRRLRKIGAQTASLGWRTIIGKISAAVDWRD
jgi:hypothetical protein